MHPITIPHTTIFLLGSYSDRKKDLRSRRALLVFDYEIRTCLCVYRFGFKYAHSRTTTQPTTTQMNGIDNNIII